MFDRLKKKHIIAKPEFNHRRVPAETG